MRHDWYLAAAPHRGEGKAARRQHGHGRHRTRGAQRPGDAPHRPCRSLRRRRRSPATTTTHIAEINFRKRVAPIWTTSSLPFRGSVEGAAAASALASAVELRSRRKRHELTPLGQDSHLRAYGAHPGRVRAAAPPQGRVSSARCACARARRRRVRRIGAQGGASGVLLKPLSLHDEGVRRSAASPRFGRRDAGKADWPQDELLVLWCLVPNV